MNIIYVAINFKIFIKKKNFKIIHLSNMTCTKKRIKGSSVGVLTLDLQAKDTKAPLEEANSKPKKPKSQFQ